MSIICHDYKDINHLESVIVKEDGTPLRGEIDMYRRIYTDCKASDYTWHFWHDLRLTIPVGNQSEIQIDFFLVCEMPTSGEIQSVASDKISHSRVC
jgi:hypothetical protein